MHPLAQFGITGSERYEWNPQAGVFDEPPVTGDIDRELLDPLASVLARHTGTPSECWFAVWEGRGRLPGDIRSAPTFSVPARTYHLVTGPIDALRELVKPLGANAPSLWWPQDHAWCVATDVDLKTTYIGADHHCAQELLSLPKVEVATIASDSGTDWLSNRVNPRQDAAPQ
jgi:hypothetical protein